MNNKKYKAGEIRPSQLLTTYGIGSLIDLPHLSAIVLGLEDWNTTHCKPIQEDRLLLAIQTILGKQVKQLLSPPSTNSPTGNPFSPEAQIGVPVATFPRWMVCPRCHLLAPISSGHFELKVPGQTDRIRYVHKLCPGRPTVLPSRFMLACEAGHLDDFPWHHFVHGPRPCNAQFKINEVGVSGEPSEIIVSCQICGAKRVMAEAFNSDESHVYKPDCTGRRLHLRDKESCTLQARTMLLAASNSWFPLIFSTLSLPQLEDELEQVIEAHWSQLQDVEAQIDIPVLRKFVIPEFQKYTDEDIWQRIEQRKQATDDDDMVRPTDLKIPEWRVLTDPLHAPASPDFEVSQVNPPEGYSAYIEQVVLVERLREVRAITGFTRIESLIDYAEDEELPSDHIMPLARHSPYWIPASEVRGEGIFIQFREEVIERWLDQHAAQQHNGEFFEAHKRWRQARHIEPANANYPGLRYVLLHTFAHALMRQLTLACGYTAASLSERIYAQDSTSEGGAMAGILLYTAASDSEGTLGGLVSLGRPDQLVFHIDGALDAMQHCSSDPLCAEHESREDKTLHEAACHACMFIPETSCERGNRYLDRSLLTSTVKRDDLAFFARS
ncbi:MAG TPA: DUF1998 domain-containing protein [Ktedonobacteraceae bacterium]|nr:DUF1998 domain-containing protein [Ktedonobacteraceae bacterium]